MAKETERTILINGREVRESQLPKLFDLVPLFNEFKQVFEEKKQQIGKESALQFARNWLFQLAIRQLKPFIQEAKGRSLSPRFLYELRNIDNHWQLHDPGYYQSNVLDRSNPYYWYGLDESAGVAELTKKSGLIEEVIDRFLLEYQQIKNLLENHLAQHPVLAHATLDHISKWTSSISVELDGKLVEGYASDWYLNVLPATPVHPGGKSYLNAYRIVAISQDDEVKYYVEKQGYFHRHSRKVQVEQFVELNNDYQKITDEDLIFAIRQLQDRRSAKEMLMDLGIKAGDWTLPLKVRLQESKQKKQIKDIENAARVIVDVLTNELSNPSVSNRSERLDVVFEALGNPLFKGRKIPHLEIVDSYKENLVSSVNRTAFITSLLGSIPSLAFRVGGWTVCGGLSAGGLMNPKVMNSGVRGFGGLEGKDSCITCPSCKHLSTDLMKCSNCGYKRKEGSRPSYQKELKQSFNPTMNSKELGSSKSNHQQGNFLDVFFTKNTVGVDALLSKPRKTISVGEAFQI